MPSTVACRRHIQGRDGHDEASEDAIVVADRVDDVRSDHSGRPVDRGRVAEEGVEVLDDRQGCGAGAVHAKDAVDRLNGEAVADTQRMVRGLHGELAAAVGRSLVAVVQTLDTDLDGRVGRGDRARGDDRRIQRVLMCTPGECSLRCGSLPVGLPGAGTVVSLL